MEYRRLNLSDIEKIKPFLRYAPTNTCDYTLGGVFMWRDYLQTQFCISGGVFYSKVRFNNEEYFSIPLAENLPLAIDNLIKGNESNNLKFFAVPESVLSLFDCYRAEYRVTIEEDYGDYLYLAENFKSFAGKKYGGQRNLVHQFKRRYPDYVFAPISKDNVKEVIEFFEKEYLKNAGDARFEREENIKTREVLENFSSYSFLGGVLKADGKIVGFSLAEKLGDTLFDHIEKADRETKGAYQTLVNEFAKAFAADCTFINREEDMGDVGLKTSKLSYHPITVLKKYFVNLQK